jgi:hypothetical protein
MRLVWLVGALAITALTSTGIPVGAQQDSRDDVVVKLAGKRLRVDKTTGKLRAISKEEATALVATLTNMTHRQDISSEQRPDGAEVVQMAGFGHVMIARPNEDGTSDVRCVSSVDEAAEFLVQSAAANDQGRQ